MTEKQLKELVERWRHWAEGHENENVSGTFTQCADELEQLLSDADD